VVIDKARKQLVLLTDHRPLAEFPASFGIDPDSDKYKAFDSATPEGLYVVTQKKFNSRFHRLLAISYPNLANAEKGLAGGVISPSEFQRIRSAAKNGTATVSDTGLGGGIAIHGGGVFRNFAKTRERDWTRGCIALNDADVEKVFDFCRSGDPVIIFNSRRSLYGIIRPFARATDLDEAGRPRCLDGVCTYQVEVPTSLGRMNLVIKEGKAYGKSIKVVVDDDEARKEPLLVIVDHNADGILSPLDEIGGPADSRADPDAAYKRARDAVIDALSRGAMVEGKRWPMAAIRGAARLPDAAKRKEDGRGPAGIAGKARPVIQPAEVMVSPRSTGRRPL
jgi:hypothetical protein